MGKIIDTGVCQGFFPSGAEYLIITKERQVLASAPYAPHGACLEGAKESE